VIEVFKFWVRYRYEKNKEWKDPKLGDGNIQGILKHLRLGMPGHPLFRLQNYRYILLGAIFFSSHDMCFAWSVFSILFIVWIKSLDLNYLIKKGTLPWLVNYLTTQCPSLISFGVVCHLLMCFMYILWVNGGMNWMS